MTAVFDIKSSKALMLNETLVDGGYVGLTLLATGMPTQVTLTNVSSVITKS